MIKPGDKLENPVTREVLIFHETAAQTDGKLVRIETIVQPGGFVAAPHVHPAQTESFSVVEGKLAFRVGSEIVQASSGDSVVVPPGTAHTFRNVGDDEARFVCEISPALRFESLIETMFALAVEGKTNKRGLPNVFRLAVIAADHFDTVRLPFPPSPLQRIALAVGAPLGRMLGYEATYAYGSERKTVALTILGGTTADGHTSGSPRNCTADVTARMYSSSRLRPRPNRAGVCGARRR